MKMKHTEGQLRFETDTNERGRTYFQLNTGKYIAVADLCGRKESLSKEEWETVQANATANNSDSGPTELDEGEWPQN